MLLSGLFLAASCAVASPVSPSGNTDASPFVTLVGGTVNMDHASLSPVVPSINEITPQEAEVPQDSIAPPAAPDFQPLFTPAFFQKSTPVVMNMVELSLPKRIEWNIPPHPAVIPGIGPVQLQVDLENLRFEPIQWSNDAKGLYIDDGAIGFQTIFDVIGQADYFTNHHTFLPNGTLTMDIHECQFDLELEFDFFPLHRSLIPRFRKMDVKFNGIRFRTDNVILNTVAQVLYALFKKVVMRALSESVVNSVQKQISNAIEFSLKTNITYPVGDNGASFTFHPEILGKPILKKEGMSMDLAMVPGPAF